MELVRTHDQIASLVSRIRSSRRLGFDTESSGPLLVSQSRPDKFANFINMYKASLTGASFAFDDGYSCYLPINHANTRPLPHAAVRDVLRATGACPLIIAHNAAHELLALSERVDATDWRFACTQVLMWMVQKPGIGKGGRPSFGLKQLAKTYLNRERPDFLATTGGRSVAECTPEEVTEYACYDAIDALELFDKFYGEMDKYPGMEHGYWNREMMFMRVIRHMEDTGMYVDPAIIETLKEAYSEELTPLLEEWDFLTDGCNPNSSKQLQRFYEDGTWKTRGIAKTTTGYSTKADYIEMQQALCKEGSLGYVLADLRLRIAGVSKLLNTYCGKMIWLSEQYDDKMLHCNFNHTGTVTGRISSDYPNLMNIPVRTEAGKRLLKAFTTPPDGKWDCLVASDFSQLEPRILAHFAGSGKLRDAFLSGKDLHQQTADLIGRSRFVGKTTLLATMYGSTSRRIARLLKTSNKEATDILDALWKAYPEAKAFKQAQVDFAYKHGYVTTIGGRIRDLRDKLGSSNKYERWSGERIAGNTPVQGSAGDIVKDAQIMIWQHMRENGFQDRMCNQIHDDIMSYSHSSRAEQLAKVKKECMENAMRLAVPLKTEPSIGPSWFEVK